MKVVVLLSSAFLERGSNKRLSPSLERQAITCPSLLTVGPPDKFGLPVRSRAHRVLQVPPNALPSHKSAQTSGRTLLWRQAVFPPVPISTPIKPYIQDLGGSSARPPTSVAKVRSMDFFPTTESTARDTRHFPFLTACSNKTSASPLHTELCVKSKKKQTNKVRLGRIILL